MSNLTKAPRVYKCVECGARRCGKRNEVCEVCQTLRDAADDTSVLRPGNPSPSQIERLFRGGR